MSRSGYSEDCDHLNLYRGNVARTLASRRGQAFLAELATALDAMPQKRLVSDLLVENGEACAMGAVALKRGLDVSKVDPDDSHAVGSLFGISSMMAAEIAYINDDDHSHSCETPEQRWERVRKWVTENSRSTAMEGTS